MNKNSLILLLLVMNLASPAQARGPFGKSYLEQITTSLKLVFVADAESFKNMQLVSQQLQQYYRRRGHLPEPGYEQDDFRTNLGKQISFNPYKPEVTDLYTNQKVTSAINIYFLSDGSITKDSVRNWRKSPPSSWQGEPGSIFVLTNGNGLFAIWAASADRLPMRKLQTDGSTRIICHDMCNPENRPQISNSGYPN